MFFRGPLSPKISAVWFLLIAALGPLIREEKAAKAAYTKTKTLKKLVPFVVARVLMYTLVPLVVVLAGIAFVSMAFAVVAMFWQWQLFGVWASLIAILLVKIPVFAFFDALGCGDEKVDYTGIENRAIKWIIAASEGAEFKYYFVAGLQVASTVLQFFILSAAFRNFEYEVGNDKFSTFLTGKHLASTDRSFGDLYGRLYADFFELTTVSVESNFGQVDFLVNWKLPPIGMPNIDFDVIMVQFSKITLSAGVAFLALEKGIDVIVMVVEKLASWGSARVGPAS